MIKQKGHLRYLILPLFHQLNHGRRNLPELRLILAVLLAGSPSYFSPLLLDLELGAYLSDTLILIFILES